MYGTAIFWEKNMREPALTSDPDSESPREEIWRNNTDLEDIWVEGTTVSVVEVWTSKVVSLTDLATIMVKARIYEILFFSKSAQEDD